MPSHSNNHQTVRFFELAETVSRSVSESEKHLLLPLLRNIRQEVETAGYKVPAIASAQSKMYAQFRYEELLEVGCVVEAVDKSNIGDNSAPTKPATASSTHMTYTNRADKERVRCAHQRFYSPSSSKTATLAVSGSAADARDEAHRFQTAFNNSLKEFVGKFKQQLDPELIPDGTFYVVFSAGANGGGIVADFYCVLANEPPAIPVILDHDGGVDDLIALLVLASASVKPLSGMARKVELLGTTVLDADCFAKPTGELCRRLLCMFGRVSKAMSRLPVGVSPLAGTAFPFPAEWRKDCIAMLDFPCLHTEAVDEAMRERPEELDGTGHELLAKLVMESPRPVTIVVTGPLTNVAYCLGKYGGAFAKNVREISIMGGAVHVAGNVINADLPKTAHAVDKTAEWNIYWDAPAAKAVLESPLVAHKLLYSLDATNHVPVTPAFVHRFGKVVDKQTQMPTQLSVFCGNSWAMTTFLGFMFGDDRGYFAWDVLSAMGILVPTIAKYEQVRIVVDADSKSQSEGRTRPVSDQEEDIGQIVNVALTIDAEAFYNLVLESAALF